MLALMLIVGVATTPTQAMEAVCVPEVAMMESPGSYDSVVERRDRFASLAGLDEAQRATLHWVCDQKLIRHYEAVRLELSQTRFWVERDASGREVIRTSRERK